MIIDTHSHLYDEAFDADREEVVARAVQTGVGRILLPNINASTIGPMHALVQSHPKLFAPMMGLHPTDLDDHWQQVLEHMHSLLPGPYVAIGEVGLDYYWSREREADQLIAFERQVEWAEEFDLPLMIHVRKAHRETVDIISRHKATRGVFHCFSGSAEEARELLAFPGYVLGIGGVLTFKKCRLPQVLADIVPLDRIVLETDSPYLAPAPHRGERNESALLTHVVQALATIYQTTAENVERVTTHTAETLFGLA